MALTFERISALPVLDVDLHPEPAVLALELQDPVLLGRAVVRGARRAGRVYRLDPPLHGALAEVVLVHGFALGFAGVPRRVRGTPRATCGPSGTSPSSGPGATSVCSRPCA